jgi:hypothetical protein
MGDSKCIICGKRPAVTGLVCDQDKRTIHHQLAGLPRQVQRVADQVVPLEVGDDARVSTTRVHAGAPARVDALSLTGPGSEDVEWVSARSVLHPAVRQWTTSRTVTVEQLVDGRPVRQQRTVTDWHRELLVDDDGRTVLVANDDQAGLVPPAEWLDSWVRRWRVSFGHHVPRRSRPVNTADTAAPQTGRAEREERARVLLGLTGYVEPARRADDPVAAEWALRFGPRPASPAVAADVRYLLTWIDQICDHRQVAVMATELRALAGELARVIGDGSHLQWLGRCPTAVVDEQQGTGRPCGAGLWQDPHVSQIQCPRCASTWGPQWRQIMGLARQIRAAWPLDRRRRYTDSERTDLPAVACPGCSWPVTVTWRESTGRGDRQRWWNIQTVQCRLNCPDARRVLA